MIRAGSLDQRLFESGEPTLESTDTEVPARRLTAASRVTRRTVIPYPVNAPGTGLGAPRIEASESTPSGMSDTKGSPYSTPIMLPK